MQIIYGIVPIEREIKTNQVEATDAEPEDIANWLYFTLGTAQIEQIIRELGKKGFRVPA